MYYKKKIFVKLIITLLIIPILSACNTSNNLKKNNESYSEKINVFTTLYVLEEFSNRIGGEYVNVVNLVPPGVSPHDYEPSAKDIAALMKGDIFIYNGGGMELWLDKIIVNLQETNMSIYDASVNIELLKGVEHNHEDSERNTSERAESKALVDPHVWLNPLNALKQAEIIKQSFVDFDPVHKSFYESNYLQLKDEIIALDNKYENELKNIKQKDFFVSHAAFGYLAERYGLVQHSLSGFSPENEPSPAELSEVINDINELNIKYILVDPNESTKISQVIAEEIDVKTENINTISSLSKEELAQGLDYFKMMERNLDVLTMSLSE